MGLSHRLKEDQSCDNYLTLFYSNHIVTQQMPGARERSDRALCARAPIFND